MSAGGAQFKSREDQRRTRELEEARKAGTIPAERDADGNEINPHIPQVRRAVFWSREALRHGQNGKVRRVRNREWACSFVRLV
jgi:pre-mRNA-processing factor SLU7